jgi:hypothetical protein
MDHQEATETKAAERYLLDELTPELRDAFEEHAFDCPECSLNLRAGAAFIHVAKGELPKLLASGTTVSESTPGKGGARRSFLAGWLGPAFVVPAFAALLLVIAYQNLSTIPNLRSAAAEPHILPATSFHAGTRGAETTSVQADRKQGFVLAIQLPEIYSSYDFTLYNPQGAQQWTRSVPGTAVKAADGTVSLFVPGQSLENGLYSLSITGIAEGGGRTEIERRVLNVQVAN